MLLLRFGGKGIGELRLPAPGTVFMPFGKFGVAPLAYHNDHLSLSISIAHSRPKCKTPPSFVRVK